MDSISDYVRNDTLRKRKEGLLECVIFGGCTYQMVSVTSDPQLEVNEPGSRGTRRIKEPNKRSLRGKSCEKGASSPQFRCGGLGLLLKVVAIP